MVLQGKPSNGEVSKSEEENTNLSKINSDNAAKDSSDVTISDIQMDTQILDTLDNTKNPTSDLNLDSNIFEAVAPVSDVDMSLPTSSMNIEHSALDTEGISLTESDPHIETSSLSWNHNSLSINNESDCMNPLKADTNLNQMNTSESNTIHTPLSAPADNKMIITTSNDMSSLTDAVTPSSLGIPLVSPVETIPKDAPLADTPLTDSQTMEISDSNKSPSQKPELVSPTEQVQSPPKSLEPIKSPVPLPPLTSGYELPRICLLLDENEVPSLPPRPPMVPVTQLYPPTPSITVCNFCIEYKNCISFF